tara:strand:- start:37485 stop:39374 length:1890 start_codon:yes stop_codon:yes gene_type:complete
MDINNDINKEDVNDHRDPDHSKPWRISDFPGLTTPFRVGSKAIYDKYMALLKLFRPNENNKILHTNFDSEVRLTENNPLTGDVKVNDIGLREVVIESISEKDWEEKYASKAPSMARNINHRDKTKTVVNKEKFFQSLNVEEPPQLVIAGPGNDFRTYNALETERINAEYITQREATSPITVSPTSFLPYLGDVSPTPFPLDMICQSPPSPGPAMIYATNPFLPGPGNYPAYVTNHCQQDVSGNSSLVRWQWILTKIVGLYPGQNLRNIVFSDVEPPGSPTSFPQPCWQEDIIGSPPMYYLLYKISYIAINTVCDLITNTAIAIHPLSPVNGGMYYEYWEDLMDDLISGGYYTGVNTDSPPMLYFDTGITIQVAGNGCLCPPNQGTTWAGYSCNSQYCQSCINASADCNGYIANGKIGWELTCGGGGCNTGANSSFDWNVTDGGGNIVTAGIKDGVAGTSIITIGSGAAPTANSSFTLACWQTHGHLPGNYTCHITNFTGGGNTYPDININGQVLGNPIPNCIPGDPNYSALCCTPSWNCISPCDCIDPGDGSGTYSTLNACQQACICETWNCDPLTGICSDPGDGSGQYTGPTGEADCLLGCPSPPQPPNEPESEAIDCNTFIKPCDEY